MTSDRARVGVGGGRGAERQVDAETEQDCWFIGEQRLSGAGREAMAGWIQYPPNWPRRLSDVDPYNWDATARLAKVDELGQAQILYPNVALFHGAQLIDAADRMLQSDIIRAYNDWPNGRALGPLRDRVPGPSEACRPVRRRSPSRRPSTSRTFSATYRCPRLAESCTTTSLASKSSCNGSIPMRGVA